MRKTVAILLLGAAALLASGCVHHHGRHHVPKPKKVALHGHAHLAPNLVVVHVKPARHRHCSAHAGHWHCRR